MERLFQSRGCRSIPQFLLHPGPSPRTRRRGSVARSYTIFPTLEDTDSLWSQLRVTDLTVLSACVAQQQWDVVCGGVFHHLSTPPRVCVTSQVLREAVTSSIHPWQGGGVSVPRGSLSPQGPPLPWPPAKREPRHCLCPHCHPASFGLVFCFTKEPSGKGRGCSRRKIKVGSSLLVRWGGRGALAEFLDRRLSPRRRLWWGLAARRRLAP